MDELIDVSKIKNTGYRLSETKSKLFKTEIEWIGAKITQNGIRPLQDKVLAIKKLKEPKNEKELKSFLGTIQYFSKHIENFFQPKRTFRDSYLQKIWSGRTCGSVRKLETKDQRRYRVGHTIIRTIQI